MNIDRRIIDTFQIFLTYIHCPPKHSVKSHGKSQCLSFKIRTAIMCKWMGKNTDIENS